MELVSDFQLIHGECVAVGIAFAAFLATELGYADEAWAKTQVETLQAYHQDCRIPENLSTDDILAAMKKDKKVRDGKIEFILLSGPGRLVQRENGDYGIPVDEEVLREKIEKFRGK